MKIFHVLRIAVRDVLPQNNILTPVVGARFSSAKGTDLSVIGIKVYLKRLFNRLFKHVLRNIDLNLISVKKYAFKNLAYKYGRYHKP